MPVPEGLSFDHLDTLGTIGPHIYHLPFQDTLIPWSRRWLWGLRSPPALDDSTDYVAGCVSDQRVDIHDVPHICSDSSPELIPTAEGLCSAFCLEEDPETNVIAAKVPHPTRLLVPLCHRQHATGLALQGPGPPQPQAGALLCFGTSTRSSRFRRRHGGHVQAHSTALCTCLGSWQLNPAPGFISCTLSPTLRFGIIAARSRRGGNTTPATSLVTIDAAWQTTPCCDVLLPACGDHDVHWEAGASAFLHHTGDACGPCSGGSDCSDRQSRHRFSWLSTCPAQRLAQPANALPPLSLRRVLRRKQSPRRPQCEDGSTPASTSFYRKRGGVLRTHRISWPRPRRNWNPSPDWTFLNASGCCRKDVISLGSCRHLERDSAFAMVDVSICYRRLLPRTPALGPLCPPMVKAPGPRRQLPLTPGRVLLVIGREWRRGSAGCLVRTFLYLLGPPCYRRSICLRPSEERLALTEACFSIISVLRNPVRMLSPLDGAAFSSYIARDVGPAHLPFMRGTAIHLNDYGRRPGKNGSLYCLQDLARMQPRLYTPSCIGPRLPLCLCLDRIARSRRSKPFSFGRAGFGLLPLLANGRELGRRCSYRSSTLHCPPLRTRDWGACYCRPASPKRNAGRRGLRRRRRRTAHCRPPCGWLLHYRWHTLRVVPGRYVRRRLLCPLLTWPCCYRRNGRRWHMPLRWSSRVSSCRPCGLHRSAALIVTTACAACACLGAHSSLAAGLCSTLSLSSVGVCLAFLLGLTNLVTLCWHTNRGLLRFDSSLHHSDAFICRYIRSLHAMLPRTSLFYFGRASWGPKSPGGGGFLLLLLYLLVQPCHAVSAAPKPRVVGASTPPTGADSTVSQHATAVAKPCGPHGLPNGARKRAFRRARNRVAQAGPDGHTWYRGRRCSAADLGLLRSRSSIITPLHSARARKIVTQPPSRVFTCQHGHHKGTRLLHLPRFGSAGSSPCFP